MTCNDWPWRAYASAWAWDVLSHARSLGARLPSWARRGALSHVAPTRPPHATSNTHSHYIACTFPARSRESFVSLSDTWCLYCRWPVTVYPVGYFDVVWASPPCETFSSVRRSNIGRNGYTRESIERDMLERGVPILRKTEEIISYFQTSAAPMVY